MTGESDPSRAAASILWRLACVEQQLDRMRVALRHSHPYSPAHLYAAVRDNGSVRLYASAWVKFLRLRGVRADGLDGRILAARVSSKDDGVSLADFLRWTRPSICVSLCEPSHVEASNLERTALTVSQKEPEELVAYMGLLEVEAAADVAAAATAARDRCRGQCVPCTLYSCIDTSKKGTVTEADLARAMAILQQPSFSAVSRAFNRLDRRSNGSLTPADWAVEFLHTEVACKCNQHITTTGLVAQAGLLGPLPSFSRKNEYCIRLQNYSPSSHSSPRSKNESLQPTGQGISDSSKGGYMPTYLLPQNFAVGNRPREHLRVLSAGTGSRRVCSVCLLPKFKGGACNRTAATAAANISFSEPRGAFKVKGHRQSHLQPCSCNEHSYCARRNPNVRREVIGTEHAIEEEQLCHLCRSLPSEYCPPCCSLPFTSLAGVASSPQRMRRQLSLNVEAPGDAPESLHYCTLGAIDKICTCTTKGRAYSAKPSVFSPSYTSRPKKSDQTQTGTLRPLTPASAPEHASSLNALETSQGTQRMGNHCVEKTNHLLYDVRVSGCNSGGQLATASPRTTPHAIADISTATPPQLHTGSCLHCASMIFPKGAVASVPALPNTASTARKRSPSPERSAHCPHTKQHSTNELQQHLSGKILQQLRTEVQQRLQQKVKEQLHTYRQQIPTPTNQKTLCDRRANGQIVHLPQPEAPQDKGSAAQAEMDMLQQHDRTRWSSETSATGTATPVFLSGTLGKKRGSSRLKRSYSGPVNATFQLWDQPALPNPVPEACEQRMQWLQSWSSEAQGLKEKQLLATLKELNTRPDFALVDVWRVFDPEGAGISEARRVQDGFSRLGIRCSGQEAQCFIWYYCPPHPIGLTFPIFASLFAAGGDEQLPLLRCIQQQNPSTVPAAYLALSSRTRKLLATFLRLALDKAISRWVARSLKTYLGSRQLQL